MRTHPVVAITGASAGIGRATAPQRSGATTTEFSAV
jgi:NADP-dependent 3-hydroxy acid dehydrogenase YdfG